MDATGSDGESGAAERRLAEALRAQAVLGARAPQVPGRPAGAGQGAAPGGQQESYPARRPPTPLHTATPHTRQGPGGQPARDRADVLPPLAVGVVDGDLAAAPTAQQPVLPGKPGAGKQGPPAGPWSASAQTGGTARGGAPHAGAWPRSTAAARSTGRAGARVDADRAAWDARPTGFAVHLRWVLLAGLLGGVLLGCLLAVLSVLDTGLLPALG